MDRYVRLWDLQSGVPLTSRKLSGTVRAVAMDPMQLAAAASPQGVIRMWSADPATAGAALFDIEGSAGSHLVGHTGPVTCLELDDRCEFSDPQGASRMPVAVCLGGMGWFLNILT